MARRLIALAALGTLGLSLTGCVSQDKYNALKIERDQLAEQLGASETDAARNKEAASNWKSQLDRLIANSGDREARAEKLAEQIALLERQAADYKAKYEAAMQDKGQIVFHQTRLPEQETTELQRFAANNPQLVEFDPVLGVLRFKSDVTFAPGSAELTPAARQAIGQLAGLLNNSVFQKYEFVVVGHTDNVRVSNPATLAAGHKDNWYLSSHRSISVGGALAKDGVAPYRLGVLGYADQKPIADNGTSEGRAKNRRVEIMVLPSTHRGSTVVEASAPAPRTGNVRAARNTAPTRRTPPADLNKDSAVIDNRPVIGNK